MRRLLAAPFHPIFTHFTIALTASSLAFDALGRMLDAPSLSTAGWWTVAAAVPATVGTLASGVTSRVRLAMEEGEARAWLRAHMALGPSFFGGLVAVALWRASLWAEGARVPWSYLGVMAALVLVMTVQGYLGGELVYRFGAEVRGRYPRLPNERERPPRPEPGASAGTT
jgi:uncharacterized membrane protein